MSLCYEVLFLAGGSQLNGKTHHFQGKNARKFLVYAVWGIVSALVSESCCLNKCCWTSCEPVFWLILVVITEHLKSEFFSGCICTFWEWSDSNICEKSQAVLRQVFPSFFCVFFELPKTWSSWCVRGCPLIWSILCTQAAAFISCRGGHFFSD